MISYVLPFLEKLYVKVFSRSRLSNFNNLLLRWCINARGYNNFRNLDVSGESHFIDVVLRRTNPSVCVDVGANAGSYASALLGAHANTTVYAFEPLEEPFQRLLSLKKNFGERLVAVNQGVGQENEVLTIHFNENATSLASFVEGSKNISFLNNDLSADVEVVTLDRYFTDVAKVRQIDFIKIDTEGFEYEVLCGAQNVIATFKPKMIQIEYNRHHIFTGRTLYSFAVLLAEYELYQMLPGRLARRDPADPLSNIFYFSNFVFVRKDQLHLVANEDR